ncbi:hypothetical protein [Pseudomonas tohonis]|uniref:hypothetical protein n=1 Tax=Pseudomonas tohonis TaxID=2725477 RepID=UPI001F176A1B|nr:hypothetical protein [Pseudomonas tohonis]GJN49473.1 hypothetical protein TUM20249_54590 [Pseudomonas tohonis]
MTLATHCTQAPAARKRGGGPTLIDQVNAMTLGRHPLPEGGEINSLCRAAAGIIPSLPAGSGAHVYPTKSVRGGAEDVHRSANLQPPAAQPVKGYKRPSLKAEERLFPTTSTLQTLARAFYGLPLSGEDGREHVLSAFHCRRLQLLDAENCITSLGMQILTDHARDARHQVRRAAA